jgi:hypothetical protein
VGEGYRRMHRQALMQVKYRGENRSLRYGNQRITHYDATPPFRDW